MRKRMGFLARENMKKFSQDEVMKLWIELFYKLKNEK